MNTVGVICEFNPFHNGHKFLIENIKSRFSHCRTVAIMSGSFVQRGDVAITDKFSRAKQALQNGFDLVVELPAVYAVSSAEIFAKAGVKIADALCCDTLAFGAEDDLETLKKIADLHFDNSFQEIIKSELSLGKSYPKALQDAVLAYDKSLTDSVDTLSGANNILAVEYLKALKDYTITPSEIKRKAVTHDSSSTSGEFASASEIRRMFYENEKNPYKFMPDTCIKEDFSNIASLKNIEKAILYRLRTMTKEDLLNLPDVSEGLENRILNAVRNYNSVNEILQSVKTKRYTHARLRRILIYALLSITKEMQKIPVPYVRVLGFNQQGVGILTDAKKAGKIPIISKVTSAATQLNDKEKVIFEKDLLASDIRALAQNTPTKCGMDYYNEIVKIQL